MIENNAKALNTLAEIVGKLTADIEQKNKLILKKSQTVISLNHEKNEYINTITRLERDNQFLAKNNSMLKSENATIKLKFEEKVNPTNLSRELERKDQLLNEMQQKYNSLEKILERTISEKKELNKAYAELDQEKKELERILRESKENELLTISKIDDLQSQILEKIKKRKPITFHPPDFYQGNCQDPFTTIEEQIKKKQIIFKKKGKNIESPFD